MADDQVKYSDLFSNDVITGIENLNRALNEIKEAMADVKNEAASLGTSMRGMSSATREQQQQVSAGATAADQLRTKLEHLRDAQNKNLAGWTLLTRSIDGTNMSYDQMKATVAALEKVLHTLTTEEEKNSMGAQSAKDAIARLRDAMKSFSSATNDAVKSNKAYKKLTDDEIASVEALKAALNGTVMQQMDAVKAIDVQNKSYNELYQTYNALKDVLNGMTVAERENSEAGKLMVDRAKEIRDTLNNLQQQTGNYTLNVGNYSSALNGLKFQFQQIARELPSAQNASQFFLAISNNIPMFADAMARYKKELPDIREKYKRVTEEIERQRGILGTLVEGSTEHQQKLEQINDLVKKQKELSELNISPMKALKEAAKGWQTWLVLGLVVLRLIPEWVEKIKERWDRWRNGVKEVKNEITAIAAMARLQADVIKKTADEATELRLVVDKLKDVRQGTDEWAAGIKTVNDITKSNLDVTKATPAEVDKVTDAYIKQANQLAKNAILSDMIAKSMANQSLREIAYEPGTYGTARQALGLEIGSKEEKEFNRLFMARKKAIDDYNNKVRKRYASDVSRTGAVVMSTETEEEASVARKKELADAIQDYRNFINKRLEVLSTDAQDKLEHQYELIDPLKNRKDKKGHTYNAKDVDFLESELLDKDAVIELESSYQRRLAMLKEAQLKERLVVKEKYEQEQKDLEFNKKKGLITEEEYNEQLAKLNKHYDELTKTNYEGNFEEMGVIQRKYWNKRNELAAKEAERQEKEEERRNAAALQEVKDEEENFKKFQEIKKREFELTAHTATEEKKFVMEQQMELLQWRIDHAEALGISPEMLEVMEQEYKQMKKMYDLGNYSSGKQNVKGNYTSVMDMLFPDLDNDQKGALNSVFDQAKEALNGWMDARKAAAEQAKELADDEVSAAENALNREIELRNQGYANDVALRERELADAKKRQKEAADMQKKAEKDALAVNSAMEASSMAVAIANLFKDFPLYAAIPLTAVLLGSFAAAKVQSFQAIKSTKYKEGGVMLLEGGSHESGHDVNLGIGPDGSNLRAEGGEYFAVINKRNSRKYGSEIPGIVNALNSGVFEDRYIKTKDAVGLAAMAGAASGFGNVVDLSAVESGVGELVKQGERSWSTEGEYRVMRYKNLTRRVRIN